MKPFPTWPLVHILYMLTMYGLINQTFSFAIRSITGVPPLPMTFDFSIFKNPWPSSVLIIHVILFHMHLSLHISIQLSSSG